MDKKTTEKLAGVGGAMEREKNMDSTLKRIYLAKTTNWIN